MHFRLFHNTFWKSGKLRSLEVDAFGFEIPEGCRPTYVSRKSNKGKRGRPAKPQTETLT